MVLERNTWTSNVSFGSLTRKLTGYKEREIYSAAWVPAMAARAEEREGSVPLPDHELQRLRRRDGRSGRSPMAGQLKRTYCMVLWFNCIVVRYRAPFVWRCGAPPSFCIGEQQ